MLLAIDVGNTHTVWGRYDGQEWLRLWRTKSDPNVTEDELAAVLIALAEREGVPLEVSRVVVASVVPSMNEVLGRLCKKWFGCEAKFLRSGEQVGIPVTYSPPSAVGADRIANALGALAQGNPPFIVVDFGSATTFDVVSAEGAYLGGAIMAGPILSLEALFSKTAKLPQVELVAPATAIGTTTPHAIQSGVVLGYADAIDGMIARIQSEMGGQATVIATGGLGKKFARICQRIDRYDANLTLEGLRLAVDRL